MIFDKAIGTMAAVLFTTTTAAAQTSYPIIISSESQFERLGISGLSPNLAPMPNRCYHYGDGGNFISLSNALLAFYQSQGFSRRSACLALISGIRFNPETGQRLATYIWADPKLFKNGRPDPKYWWWGATIPGGPPDIYLPTDPEDISDELPISLPRCFARGLPFSDCTWRYDVLSGKRISAADTARYAEVGRRVERYSGGVRREPNQLDEHGYIWMVGGGNCYYDDDDTSPCHGIKFDYFGGEMKNVGMRFDFSHEFPKGYGYALLYDVSDGAAGSGASPQTVKAAIEGQRRPQQINLDRLREVWGTGSN
jgi:hypothetical protein